jgi:putative phosphoesterase
MRIGVLSDTHDRLPTLRAALERFAAAGIDTLFHPGDLVAPFAARALAAFSGTVHVTYGNNDGERQGLKEVLPQIQDGPCTVELAERRILLHHALEWCQDPDVASADIILTGHTHEPSAARRGDKLLLNPGECCGWVTGRATAAILDLNSLEVQWIEIPT